MTEQGAQINYQERYEWLLTQMVDVLQVPFNLHWDGYPEWFIRELAERWHAIGDTAGESVEDYVWAIRTELEALS